MGDFNQQDFTKLLRSVDNLVNALNRGGVVANSSRGSSSAEKNQIATENKIRNEDSQTNKKMINSIEELSDRLATLANELERNEDRLKTLTDELTISNKKTKAYKAKEQEKSDLEKSIPELKETIKNLKNKEDLVGNIDLDDLNKSFKKASSIADLTINTSWGAFEKASLSVNKNIASHASSIFGMLEASGLENESFDKYSAHILKNMQSSSNLLKSNTFIKGIEGSTDTIQDFTRAISKIAIETRNFETLLNSEGENIQQVIQDLYNLNASGVEPLTDFQEQILESAEAAGLIKNGIVADSKAFENHVNMIKKDMVAIQKVAREHYSLHKAFESIIDKLGPFGKAIDIGRGKLGSLAAWGMVIDGFGKALSRGYDQAVKAADAGAFYNGSFFDVISAQRDLGLSFDDTVKILKEDRQILKSMDSNTISDFFNSINEGQELLTQFGVSNEEAAKAVQANIIRMRKAGVSDVKDKKGLEKINKEQAESYKKLKAATGASTEEFAALQDEMLSNDAVQAKLANLSADLRYNEIQQMDKARQSLVDLGMGADHANKVLLSFQDANKMKLTERYSAGAKLYAAMKAAGKSDKEAEAARRITVKGVGNASEPEQKFYREQLAELKGIANSRFSMDAETQGDKMVMAENIENLIEPVNGMAQASLEAKVSAEAGQKRSEEDSQKLQDSIDAQKITGGEILRTSQSLIGGFESVMAGPAGALLEMAAGFAGLGILQIKQLFELKKIEKNTQGDSGNIGDLKDSLWSKTKKKTKSGYDRLKTSKPVSKIGKLSKLSKIGGAGAGIIATLATDYIADELKESKNPTVQTTGKVVDTLGTAAGAASTGAMLGSFLGPGGTVIVGALGGLGGLAYGAYQNLKSEPVQKQIETTIPKVEPPKQTIEPTVEPAQKPITSLTPPIQPSAAQSSTATQQQSQQDKEKNAMVVQLGEDTIIKLAAYLQSINTTATQSIELEKQQLEKLTILAGGKSPFTNTKLNDMLDLPSLSVFGNNA